MDINRFSQKVAAMHSRVSTLFSDPESLTHVPSKVASTVFKELGWAVEELQVAVEEFEHQNNALTEAVEAAHLERKRYQNLFSLATEAHLATNLEGIIQEANTVASEMLGVPHQYLIGKPLSLYISEQDRHTFRLELIRRQERDQFQDWELKLASRDRKSFDVSCYTITNRDSNGKPISFHWILKDITERKRIALMQRNPMDQTNEKESFFHNCPSQIYVSGDIISLQPQTLAYVVKGLVKLTTLTEQNQEVLIGLIGRGMPFGQELTSLPIYEAIALSDVELITFSQAEISTSCQLTQILFSGVSHRLRQTEELLALCGERQIQTRLCRLLQLLKTEIGQPVPQGVCLSIRLTHEDLASACCTTRVTITRLIKKLQQEKKITFDQKKHIILLDNNCHYLSELRA